MVEPWPIPLVCEDYIHSIATGSTANQYEQRRKIIQR